MASINTIKTNSGKSYRVKWREGDSQNGPRRQAHRTFATMEEARAHRRYVEEQIESRRVGGDKRETTHAYLDRWIEGLSVDLSPTTVSGYADKVEIAKRALPDVGLLKLQRTHFNHAYKQLLETGKLLRDGRRGPLSRQTVKHVHTVLRKAFDDARKDKLISENPVDLATPPRVGQGKKYRRKVRAYTMIEAQRMIELLTSSKLHEPDTYVMLASLLSGGMRRGEMCGLADDSIDFETGRISIFRNIVLAKNRETGEEEVKVREVPKTDASVRTIQMPPAMMELIRAQMVRVREKALAWGKDYRRRPLYLFPGVGGEAMHPRLVYRRFRRLAVAVGIEGLDNISPVHSWRHTHGTMLWAAFKNDKQVQERLGHSTPAITKALYVESTPEADAEAADYFDAFVKR
jgi:integrase